MLLEADTCICRGAYETVSSSEHPQDADGSFSDPGFSVHGPAAEEWAPPPPPEMWLVGLETRTTDGLPVWRYYIVDHALDSRDASHAALERADSAPERASRGQAGAVGRIERIEVQQIVQDVLGKVTLARRS
ncbi:hypothetical protein ACIOTI_37675 [Streptomyces sp. NPDC087843]|uniref:hypothetical protein n=1 Tax=Streptomyces sp. NPDC087843 TaxID=3365804 RepID=UPI0037FDD29E